jgi:CxxC motif-containing protein (DUF1111 family)
MRTLLSVRVFVSLSAMLFTLTVIAPTIWSAGPDESSFKQISNGFAEEFCRAQFAMSKDMGDSPPIPAEECNFDAALEEFTGPEGVGDGLGPVFNAAGCGECHGTPMIGGSSQVAEKRAGFLRNGTFFDPPGGSLIQDRSIDPRVQELVPRGANVVAFRASLSILGLGFVEAIANETLVNIQKNQSADVRGHLIQVPVLEVPGTTRVGRFGWKNQQASLLSFSADAYVNEMGITSPMQRDENSFNGDVAAAAKYDKVPLNAPTEVDDEGVDVALFALFMRSTLPPPRDVALAGTRKALNGSLLFDRIGCAECHTRTIVTAKPGTWINGDKDRGYALRVGNALGNKTIEPFSDFLLHDIGTGDGIVQNGGQQTRNMLRTVPLWGLRARGRFMHDLQSLTLTDAINRHGGQALKARRNFDDLRSQKEDVLTFLMSL